MTDSLGEAYPKEQAMLRKKIARYVELGPTGTFGRIMLEDVARRADEAAVEGDLVKMIQLFEEMKGCE